MSQQIKILDCRTCPLQEGEFNNCALEKELDDIICNGDALELEGPPAPRRRRLIGGSYEMLLGAPYCILLPPDNCPLRQGSVTLSLDDRVHEPELL